MNTEPNSGSIPRGTWACPAFAKPGVNSAAQAISNILVIGDLDPDSGLQLCVVFGPHRVKVLAVSPAVLRPVLAPLATRTESY